MFTALDLIFFFGSLVLVMGVGLMASRREKSAEEFFLAGRSVRWWGVAGSIFGSNVSANHLVGMLGIGYSIGFAQSHFEFGAVVALMLLAYGFLPVYRKLGVFTLSDYLGRRYDGRSQTLYALILVLVAHAGGSMVSGLVCGLVAMRAWKVAAVGLGLLWTCGGIAMLFMVPAPTWFAVTDILLYVPAALLGVRIGGGLTSRFAEAA